VNLVAVSVGDVIVPIRAPLASKWPMVPDPPTQKLPSAATATAWAGLNAVNETNVPSAL